MVGSVAAEGTFVGITHIHGELHRCLAPEQPQFQNAVWFTDRLLIFGNRLLAGSY